MLRMSDSILQKERLDRYQCVFCESWSPVLTKDDRSEQWARGHSLYRNHVVEYRRGVAASESECGSQVTDDPAGVLSDLPPGAQHPHHHSD